MIQTAIYSDVGGRDGNEDSAQIIERDGNVCAVVADGLGGYGGGEKASALVTEEFSKNWNGSISSEVLTKLITQAHEKIQEQQTAKCPMKSTVVSLALETGHIVWAHVGDSRLYHFYNGRLVFQTKDHSSSQIAVELGDITAEEIRFHEDRNKVFRALGQSGPLTVDARDLMLADGWHAWLLCTDGFWEYVLESEMEQALHDAGSPQQWLENMQDFLQKRLAERNQTDHDNNTAAAVWMQQPCANGDKND